MSLTEEEKERIRREEIFRAEVRASLDSDSHHPAEKVWKFLNSPFGLWVLSSILLGLLTWSYSQWQASETDSVKRRDTIKRIDTEIASRLRVAQTMVRAAQTKEQLYMAVIALNGGAAHVHFDFGVFPDLKHRSLRSLLYELKGNLKDKAALKDVNTALDAANDLDQMFIKVLNQMSLLQNSSDQAPAEGEVDSFQTLIGRFMAGRWAL
jgi:hypothetical protein